MKRSTDFTSRRDSVVESRPDSSSQPNPRKAQGLHERNAIALARRVGYDKTPAGAFRLITATPRERCDAALAVIEQDRR